MSIVTINTMLDWIELHIEENPTLHQISGEVGYSPWYCSVKFHEFIGVSFKEYSFRRKLSLAAHELLETQMRILDIALKYGFSSQEAFTRAFVKAFGFTPRKFRVAQPPISSYAKAQVQAGNEEG